jgi:hypothetical protein
MTGGKFARKPKDLCYGRVNAGGRVFVAKRADMLKLLVQQDHAKIIDDVIGREVALVNDAHAGITVLSECPGALNGTADNNLNFGYIRRVESVDCIFQDMAGRHDDAVVDQCARARAFKAARAANFYLNRALGRGSEPRGTAMDGESREHT